MSYFCHFLNLAQTKQRTSGKNLPNLVTLLPLKCDTDFCCKKIIVFVCESLYSHKLVQMFFSSKSGSNTTLASALK
jgi:hypothetical protein